MLGNVYGLDLGTYEIKIFDKKKDRLWRVKKNQITKNKKYIFVVGKDGDQIYEKTPAWG